MPGYRAPAEQTTGPGTRVITLLLRLVADPGPGGGAAPGAAGAAEPPPALAADFARVRAQSGLEIDDAHLVVAVLAWVSLFGAVGFEVFGQYGETTFTEPGQLFEALVDVVATML